MHLGQTIFKIILIKMFQWLGVSAYRKQVGLLLFFQTTSDFSISFICHPQWTFGLKRSAKQRYNNCGLINLQ